MKELRSALMFLLSMTILTGVLYPLGITGVAKAFFSHKASGSVIVGDDKAVGSELIGQPFDDPRYLWGRLSATAPAYNAAASSGSNLGPMNPALFDAAKARIDALKAADPENNSPVPVDLVTASGSGLDPHISPAAAAYQLARIARAGSLSEAEVRGIIEENTEGRTFGLLGEPRVNVLQVNISLARRYGK